MVQVTAPSPSTTNLVEKLAAKRETARDDWDTEVASEEIGNQLKEIAKWIPAGFGKQPERVISERFQTSGLRPSDLSPTYQHDGITVSRGDVFDNAAARGLPVLQRALKELTSDFPVDGISRVKLKLFRIDRHQDEIRCRVYYEASSHGDALTLQQNATWDMTWSYKAVGSASRLLSIGVSDFEQSQFRPPVASFSHLFSDVTHAVLGKTEAYQEQVLAGIPYWMDRMSREFMSQFGHHGLSVGDVNGDGLDDIYVCDTGGLPNRLYVQQPDGTARDVSADSGVDLLEDSVGCLLVDLDNDHDQDLVVATDPLLQFAENDGTGKFQIRRSFYANTDSYSLCAADYDNDGDLDLYVCGYNARKQDPIRRGLPFPVPYHDANNGGQNHLLRNDGGFRFSDVTAQVGLDQHNTRFSLAAAWEDDDDDGDMDLYVANDFGRNCLYRNEGGRFVDVADRVGVEDHASGMSVSWADFNRDGRMDVYVSNMFSAAGNRVTYQRRFADSLNQDEIAKVQRMARGNTLFEADDDGTFRDVSEQQGVGMGRWAWASRFADLNNDGWQDLLVANGYVTNEETSDL